MPTPIALSTTEQRSTTLRGWMPVVIVAVAVFAVTTTEMVPMGMLPDIARDLRVSEAKAGLSVSLFGVLAGLLAPVVTVLTGRVDRRTLVLTILAVFVAGNALSALAQSYVVFMASRFVEGTIHGLMWAIVAVVAIRLVADHDGVRATALVFSGISIALVLGVPLGAFIAGAWGWRWTFALLAALCAMTFALVLATVPRLPSQRSFGFGDLFGLLRSPRLRRVLLLTGTVVIGNYAAYTFVAPLLADSGISPGMIGPFLLCYGVAGVVGNFAAGALLSRSISVFPLLLGLTCALALALLLTAFTSASPLLLVLLTAWGLSYSALPVVLQTLVLRAAGDGAGEATTSIYVLVFNCSIAGGAFAGAVAIDSGGPTVPVLVGAAFAAAGAVVICLLSRAFR